jgi:hypothetical protein
MAGGVLLDMFAILMPRTRKVIALLGLGAALALTPGAALAQQGTSSSYGTVGWGPRIPTEELTPKDRFWNHSHESQYRAEDGAEWVRLHSHAGPFPWSQ